MERRCRNPVFLNKRADTNLIYHILIQLLIAVMVYWILQSYIDSVAKDTLFEKHYLARDLALLTDTIYGSPGNVDYVYSNERAELNKFNFDFSDQRVKVSEIGAEQRADVAYPYGEDLNLTIREHVVNSPNSMAFSKTGETFRIIRN